MQCDSSSLERNSKQVNNGTVCINIPGMNSDATPLRACMSACLLVCSTSIVLAQSLPETDEAAPVAQRALTPDVRGDELKLKYEKGSFVIVPIPISDPTLGTALVLGSAYFYGQTEEQKNSQPASLTAGGAMYSSTDSVAAVIAQQNYWRQDTWRFAGAVGYADLNLELLTSDGSGSRVNADWLLNGGFLYAHLARKISGRWYLGVFGRTVDVSQAFNVSLQPNDYDLGGDTVSTGLGMFVDRDTRDMPSNAYSGNLLSVRGLFNSQSFGSDNDYESYSVAFSSYREMTDQLVLAWQLEGCYRSGTVPLWDTCRVGLRGFPATDYLGKSSAIGQVEARWRLSERWGLVGFAGGGYLDNSFNEIDIHDLITSYGIGLRFMVLKSKRINMRVDYGWSNDSNALHLSVGEAF